MDKPKKFKNQIVFLFFLIFLFLVGWNTYQSLTHVRGWVSPKLKIYALLYGIGLLTLLASGILIIFRPSGFDRLKARFINIRQGNRLLAYGLGGLVVLVPSIMVFTTEIFSLQTPEGHPVIFPMMRILVFLVCNVLAGFFLTKSENKLLAFSPLALSFLISGTVFILVDNFKDVTSYPFSLTWSEGNRIWDYSLRFGKDRYIHPAGEKIRALIDPGRQTLWGLPFLYSDVTIRGMRFWNAFLFTIPYALLGWILFYKSSDNKHLWGIAGLWCLLFLYQGPIYTPLILAAILVAGTRYFPIWVGFIFVSLAGYYAQISRYTWLFAPAMWAGMWSLLRGRVNHKGRLASRVWFRSLTLVAAGLVGGYFFPLLVESKNRLSAEGVSSAVTHHPLIWSRLWPNATYPPGIVLGLLIAVLPVVLTLVFLHRKGVWNTNMWQKVALVGGLAAFLGVGLVVSVKIGGGSNLHNLDMFLIALIFSTAGAWEQASSSSWVQKPGFSRLGLFILAAIILPLWWPLVTALPRELPPPDAAKIALRGIQQQVSQAEERGEVLFMDQRQLLTFGLVDQVPLVDEYEKKRVMNKALGGDEVYFSNFYQDLAESRFSLIINEPLQTYLYQEEERNFASENNAWVRFVAEPMLCFYQVQKTYQEVGVELLIPRETACLNAQVYLP